MWEILGVILGLVGVGVSIYFGVKRHNDRAMIRQHQSKTSGSSQTMTVRGSAELPESIRQDQSRVRSSHQDIKQ